MKRPRWTPREDRILRDLYGTVPQSKIAAKLGKTLASVYGRCHYIGLRQGFALGRNRPPTGINVHGPRITISDQNLHPGITRVVTHRLIG